MAEPPPLPPEKPFIGETILSIGTTEIPYYGYINMYGGMYPLRWDIIDGALPAGLTLEQSGIISGTPEKAGATTFTARITDNLKRSATKQLSLTIHERLIIETQSLPGGKKGIAYKNEIVVHGGVTPYSFDITYGELPKGISLDKTSGIVSGTPTESVYSNFTINVTDAVGTKETFWYQLNIEEIPIRILPTEIKAALINETYEQTLIAEDGIPPYTFEIEPTYGKVPAGVRLEKINATSAMIIGLPTEQEYGYFGITATDSAGNKNTQYYNLKIVKPLIITQNILSNATVGKYYENVYLQAEGGEYPYQWKIDSGELPPGLSLTQSAYEPAKIIGLPTKAGIYKFTLKLSDTTGMQTQAEMRINIAKPSSRIMKNNLNSRTPFIFRRSNGNLIVSFNAQDYSPTSFASQIYISRSHDNGENWSTPEIMGDGNGETPMIESDGALFAVTRNINTWQPNTEQNNFVLFTSRDGSSWTRSGAVSSITSPNAEIQDFIKTSNGYYLLYTENGPPTDLYLTRSSNLNAWDVPVRLTESGATESNAAIMETGDGATYIAYVRSPDNTIIISKLVGSLLQKMRTVSIPGYGQASLKFVEYDGNTALMYNGYDGIYYHLLENGNWSDIRKMSPTYIYGDIAFIILSDGTIGVIQSNFNYGGENETIFETLGTFEPTETSSLNFTLPFLEPPPLNGYNIPQTFTLNTGQSFSHYFNGNGGKAPYTWSMIRGRLPDGLVFNKKLWTINGIVNESGTFAITTQLEDGAGSKITQDITIEVKKSVSITTATLPDGNEGMAYSHTLNAEGGTPPYRWYINQQGYPYSFSINSETGLLQGTPSAGTFNIEIMAYDSWGGSANKKITISITPSANVSTSTEQLPFILPTSSPIIQSTESLSQPSPTAGNYIFSTSSEAYMLPPPSYYPSLPPPGDYMFFTSPGAYSYSLPPPLPTSSMDTMVITTPIYLEPTSTPISTPTSTPEIILITTSTESAPTIVTTSTESTPATSTIATSTQGLLSTFWQLGLLYYWFTSLFQ